MSAETAERVWAARGLTPEQFACADDLARVIERPGVRRHDARDIAALVMREYVAPADVIAAEAHGLLRLLTDVGALEFAYGKTTTERVLDLARDLEAALIAYEYKGE